MLESKSLIIRFIIDPDEKETIARKILSDLPGWFGLPESTKKYIEDSRSLPFWAALAGEEAVGFVTRKQTSPETAEIHCMGVRQTDHRSGAGTLLLKALEEASRLEKFLLLQVKTVAEGHYREYDQTNAFYRKMGFMRLEVFPDLWDEWNPCQILVKPL